MNRNIWVTSDKENSVRQRLVELGRDKERLVQRKYGIYLPIFTEIFFAPISDDKLGSFYPAGKYIILNEDLLDSTDSKTIDNIFIHELAHGMDYLVNGELSGHSVRFREYCAFLGIEDGFDKAKIRASIRKDKDKEAKIEKLIALTSSPFENEAMIALEKAQRLMVNLNRDKKDQERLYISELYESKRVAFYVTKLCSFVSKVSGVFIVKCKVGDISILRSYGDFNEVEFSLYLFDYLLSSLTHEVECLRKEGRHITKDSFVMGAIPEMERKLALSSADISNALVAIRDENKRKARKLVFNTGLRTIYYNPRAISRESYKLGGSFAKGLDIPSKIKQRKLT